MKNFSIGFVAAFVASTFAIQQVSAAETDPCHGLSVKDERLACYDEATGFEERPEVAAEVSDEASSDEPEVEVSPSGQQWVYSDEESALDGRKDVWLRLTSSNTEPNNIGNQERATLWLRCMGNKTNVLVDFNSYTTDAQNVRYKFDDGKLQKVWMETIRGGDGVGIWSGRRAIPFIRQMFDKDAMVLAYKSYSNENLEFSFDVSGLRQRIDPLAESCNWTP